MITGKIKNIGMYKGISANLDKAIESILNEEYLNKNIGKYEIESDQIFFSVQNLATKTMEEALFETHKKYIDIQIVIEGKENYGVLLSDENLEIHTPFYSGKDLTFFKKDAETIFTLTPEDFIIFFTDEPHMPGLKADNINNVKKVVYKIIA